MGRSAILYRIVPMLGSPQKAQLDKGTDLSHPLLLFKQECITMAHIAHLFGLMTAEDVKKLVAQATADARVATELFGDGPIEEVRANAEAYALEVEASSKSHDDLVTYLVAQLEIARANAEKAKAVVARVNALRDSLPGPSFKVDTSPFAPIDPHLHVVETPETKNS